MPFQTLQAQRTHLAAAPLLVPGKQLPTRSIHTIFKALPGHSDSYATLISGPRMGFSRL